jgi:DNA-binding transcriptional regulator YiaG
MTVMAKRSGKRHRRTDEELIHALEERIQDLKERMAVRKRRKAAAAKQKKERSPHRFSPAWVSSHREKLGVSAADYAELVGVSPLTIYSWEKGRSRPRAAQLERLAAARKLSRAQALAELGVAGAVEPPAWFSPEWVAGHRERLKLSAAAYGKLVGVTGQTVYAWEQGRSTPRAEPLAALEKVRGIKKKDAWKRVGKTGQDGRSLRFSPDSVAAHRERLELSAADYGELVGVSALTVYNWEKGKTRPRREQIEALAAVRRMGKREAWKELGY